MNNQRVWNTGNEAMQRSVDNGFQIDVTTAFKPFLACPRGNKKGLRMRVLMITNAVAMLLMMPNLCKL